MTISYSPGTAKSSEESQFLLLSTWSPPFHSCHTESAVPTKKSSMFSPHSPLHLLFFILGCSPLTSFNPWSVTSPHSIWPTSLSSILHTYPALVLLRFLSPSDLMNLLIMYTSVTPPESKLNDDKVSLFFTLSYISSD